MPKPPKTSDEIRTRWLDYFQARGHRVVPSSSLIPHDPSLLLTAAGMVQFKPYMLGDEVPQFTRAASVQKCFRATDIDRIGMTDRHFTFFEMLGNFSFGDYFKAEAIPWAWELVTEVWGLDPGLLWATVFETDEAAHEIWRDATTLDHAHLVRMGKADNFWDMGAAGPCGPCSEIYFDRGDAFGKEGGPGADEDRYVELWNLVFMEDVMDSDGNVIGELPKKNIDTGAGLDRVAMVLQGAANVFETDLTLPLLETAQSLTGVQYRRDARSDVSLRVLTDHSRAVAFLIGDGVFPSNEERGYVLRRILRRAVRHARLLGAESEVVLPLVKQTIDLFSAAYPALTSSRDFVLEVTGREETAFSRTLASGLEMLERELAALPSGTPLPGSAAFKLHDTFGFPIDLTREVAADEGHPVDDAGFEVEMNAQRDRARRAARMARDEEGGEAAAAYRDLLDAEGASRFTGYGATMGESTVLGIIRGGEGIGAVGTGGEVEIIVATTPFYGESGGQVGDVGSMSWERGRADVLDTQHPLPDLIAHTAIVREGSLAVGEVVSLVVDSERRSRVMRNHTATHVLHWALRDVLGDHVKQAGSLVAPDRLRFDFNHFSAVSPEEIAAIEELANAKVMTNQPVRAFETSRDYADDLGAIAFFGDKYGEVVRVVEAGDFSRELCGGTHVDALGELGLIRVVSEGSIGSNTRRIEALSGHAAIEDLQAQETALLEASTMLRAKPADVPAKVAKLVEDQKKVAAELRELRAKFAASLSAEIALSEAAGDSPNGRYLVARLDENVDLLRDVAIDLREHHGFEICVLGSAAGARGSLVAAASNRAVENGISAAEIISEGARILGGGGGKSAELAIAGGPEASAIEAALATARDRAAEALGP